MNQHNKFCSGCLQNLPLSDFGINKSKIDGKQTQCKQCRNKYAKQHYRSHRRYYYDKSADRREQLRQQLEEYKRQLACEKCGYNEYMCALDFHHIDDTKEINISDVCRHGWSFQRLLTEIQKCQVLCANCHRVIHCREN